MGVSSRRPSLADVGLPQEASCRRDNAAGVPSSATMGVASAVPSASGGFLFMQSSEQTLQPGSGTWIHAYLSPALQVGWNAWPTRKREFLLDLIALFSVAAAQVYLEGRLEDAILTE